MPEAEASESDDEKVIETSFVEDDKDIFDEVLGESNERKAAREARKKKTIELKEKAEKKAKSAGEEGENITEENAPETAEKGKGVPAEKAGFENETVIESAAPDEKRVKRKRQAKQKPAQNAAAKESGNGIAGEGRAGKGAETDLDAAGVKAKKQAADDLEMNDELEQIALEEEDKQQIKDVILEKASIYAQKDELLPFDKEVGIREADIYSDQHKPNPVEAKTEKEKERDEEGGRFELSLLSDEKKKIAFIGRKKSLFEKYGEEAGLFVGKVQDSELNDFNVLVDSLNPHVIFVNGARGSGKSYVLGVLAEELAHKNKNVGIIVIDPIGVFWSMRFPNKDEREIGMLAKWDLTPQGLDNLKVFIPAGVKDQVPGGTFDATFSMHASLLSTDDWCLTFGIERFSPSGLLIEKVISKVRSGYEQKEGPKIAGKKGNYTLDDLINCLENDKELHSSDKGYKPDSIRALVSRFDAAKNWGVFSDKGTPLGELSMENQLTIIDTSFLEDNVSALVIGILGRRILAARKKTTRREAASRHKTVDADEMMELEIPPTWLFIDEAHTLIPSGNVKTPATTSLIEYVKQGRQPGCSLVFATQQPSAIDSHVLSQLDIIMTHKLVFDDDIKSVFKRTPTLIPKKFRKPTFIKTLPVGTALTGDRREETSRAFVMRVRPRMSQHEGREAETAELSKDLDPEKAKKLALEMCLAKIEKEGVIELEKIRQIINTVNNKFKANIEPSDIMEQLDRKGIEFDSEKQTVSVPGYEEEMEKKLEEATRKAEEIEKKVLKEEAPKPETAAGVQEPPELLAFPVQVNEEAARKAFNAMRQKKFLGFFGKEEMLESVYLKFIPVFAFKFNYFGSKEIFNVGEAYVNSLSGEFLHYAGNEFLESRGFKEFSQLNENEAILFNALKKDKAGLEALMQKTGMDEARLRRLLKSLADKNIIKIETANNETSFRLNESVDLPANPLHPIMNSLHGLPLKQQESVAIEAPRVSKEQAAESLKRLWSKIVVKKIETVYMPAYEGRLKSYDGKNRTIFLDAMKGKEIIY